MAGLFRAVYVCHLQMLAAALMDVMQLILEVRHVGRRLLLIGEAPISRLQKRYSSVLNTVLAGVCFKLWSRELMVCMSAGRWVHSHPSMLGASERPSSGAPHISFHDSVTLLVRILVRTQCTISCRSRDLEVPAFVTVYLCWSEGRPRTMPFVRDDVSLAT